MPNPNAQAVPAQSPIQPQAQAAPATGAATGTAATPSLQQRWERYFASPGVRAAAMQFGISMLQPIASGQTFAGHVGLSLADAAQAATRSRAFESAEAGAAAEGARKERETQVAERGAAVGEAAEARAGRKETREAATAAETASLNRKKLALEEKKAASLDRYYRTIGAAAGKTKGTDVAGEVLKQYLDTVGEAAALEDDPGAALLQTIQRDLGVSLPGAAGAPKSVTQGGTALTPPQPGETVTEGGKQYRFLGGNPADENAWEEVK